MKNLGVKNSVWHIRLVLVEPRLKGCDGFWSIWHTCLCLLPLTLPLTVLMEYLHRDCMTWWCIASRVADFIVQYCYDRLGGVLVIQVTDFVVYFCCALANICTCWLICWFAYIMNNWPSGVVALQVFGGFGSFLYDCLCGIYSVATSGFVVYT